jgi:hypothetical protein
MSADLVEKRISSFNFEIPDEFKDISKHTDNGHCFMATDKKSR